MTEDDALEIKFKVQLTSAELEVAGRMIDRIVSKQKELVSFVQDAAQKVGVDMSDIGVLAVAAEQDVDKVYITPAPTIKRTPAPTTKFPTSRPTTKDGEVVPTAWPTTKSPTKPPSPASEGGGGGTGRQSR